MLWLVPNWTLLNGPNQAQVCRWPSHQICHCHQLGPLSSLASASKHTDSWTLWLNWIINFTIKCDLLALVFVFLYLALLLPLLLPLLLALPLPCILLNAVRCNKLHCTKLQYPIELHCIVLYRNELNCNELIFTARLYTVLHCTTLNYSELHSTTLQFDTLHCARLHYTSLHSTTLHCTV